jgi:hypothetical protein
MSLFGVLPGRDLRFPRRMKVARHMAAESGAVKGQPREALKPGSDNVNVSATSFAILDKMTNL